MQENSQFLLEIHNTYACILKCISDRLTLFLNNSSACTKCVVTCLIHPIALTVDRSATRLMNVCSQFYADRLTLDLVTAVLLKTKQLHNCM